MGAELFDAMRKSILDGDEELAEKLAAEALKKKLELSKVLDEGFLKGIQEVGDLYQTGEFFLPELVCAADAMKAALEILMPELKKSAVDYRVSRGQVVIATVEGDVHDIGKKIVAAMLTAAGYDVLDLGVDVPADMIIRTIEERKPEILGLSALLTTTMQEQKNVIALLEKENMRGYTKIIIGGAPVTARWAEIIHADGYSDNAADAVKLAARLLSAKS